MAKPKLSYKIEKWGTALGIYALDPVSVMDKIKGVEGVTDIVYFPNTHVISVRVNRLYSVEEIIQEIEALLSPIPDSFYETLEWVYA